MTDDWREIATIETEHPGRGYLPVLVWDDYHGMVVARRDPLRDGQWQLDAPYAFEFGGKEFDLTPTYWQPLPGLPPGVRNRASISPTFA